jgi:hypothetical protein
LDDEQVLEDFLAQDSTLVDADLLIIGRQTLTDYGKYIDLLAINGEGELVIIELKRDRTPRDVVAQVLDYASWIKELTYDDVKAIYEEYAIEQGIGEQFEEAFAERFGANPPESVNETHHLIVVASELDPGTERIIRYLAQDYAVPINAVFFQHFHDGTHTYLTRTWLQDPKVVESRSQSSISKKERWNGQDFYVSFGHGDHRHWEDARRYGFISGGQGSFYSRTLKNLFEGARVFVHIPGEGYVGVGIVTEKAQPVKDFTVEVGGQTLPILEAPHLQAPRMGENSDDEEKSEYLVGVEWEEARPRSAAHWEKGLFANQNTVCRLRNKFTLEKLRAHFGLED